MASVGKRPMVEMKGKGREMGSEGKKARVEMKGKQRILFIEIDGDLLGIDLNKYDHSDLQSESLPELAPLCCRVELRKHKYPHGMRHMKVNDKLYLLGGECFDFEHDSSSSSYLGCSNKVYEFNLDTLTTQINDNEGDEPLVLHPDHVLKPVPSLLKPMSAFVANLRGRFYVLCDKVPISNVIFNKPEDPNFTFQEFDPTNESWLPAPTPVFYKSTRNNDVSKYFMERREMSWPYGVIPLSSRLVVDNKLLLFSSSQRLVHIYIGGDYEWKTYPYHSISLSFRNICNQDVPDTGLWLSNFGFDNDANLGVMLSIQRVQQRDCYGIEIPFLYRYNALDYVFHQTYTVFAYVIDKSTCHVLFYQQLDRVFSDMIRTPLNTECMVTKYLLDLGESEHNNERRRRICAILTGECLMNRIPYLYISIFELQMTQVPSSTFLRVIPVKNLIFRFDKDKHRFPGTYDNKSVLFNSYEIPPLDAFVI